MTLSDKLLLSAENASKLVGGKRVFVRVDFNVPIDAAGHVTSDLRLREFVPTLELLCASSPKLVILASHLGRPDGTRKAEFSLKPVALELARITGNEILFVDDCIGAKVSEFCAQAPQGAIVLLENLRFHAAEEGKGASADEIAAFRQQLQSLADVYVNDAFGTAHRAHSSMVGFESFETRAAGLLMAREISAFAAVLESPRRPVLTIVGGAKVRDKTKLIYNLLKKTDMMIIGGGMAFTFLKVIYGTEIGKSLYDAESESEVRKIVDEAKRLDVELIFPCDFVTAPSFDSTETATSDDVPADRMGLDCGPKSVERFAAAVNRAATILWNGPPGVFEKPQFAAGSLGLLDAVCAAPATVKIAGGGDTTALVLQQEKQAAFSLVSTGGGAALELLEGKALPGIETLSSIGS